MACLIIAWDPETFSLSPKQISTDYLSADYLTNLKSLKAFAVVRAAMSSTSML